MCEIFIVFAILVFGYLFAWELYLKEMFVTKYCPNQCRNCVFRYTKERSAGSLGYYYSDVCKIEPDPEEEGRGCANINPLNMCPNFKLSTIKNKINIKNLVREQKPKRGRQMDRQERNSRANSAKERYDETIRSRYNDLSKKLNDLNKKQNKD